MLRRGHITTVNPNAGYLIKGLWCKMYLCGGKTPLLSGFTYNLFVTIATSMSSVPLQNGPHVQDNEEN